MIKKVLPVVFLLIICLCGCQKENKKIIISDNIANDIKAEISDSKELLLKAKVKLQDKDYAGAKVIFEKVIDLDKGNKDNYIEIKNYYVEYKRYDDAYAIIRSAIENNVDVENMTSILDEIKTNFIKVQVKDSIYQDEEYILPKEFEAVVNDENITIPIKWDVDKVDTGKVGEFIFNGVNEQYGKEIVVELNIKENVYTEEVGFIKSIYEKDNITYIDVDLVEFYTGDKALEEAIKDGNALYVDELNKYIVLNNYYMRNNIKNTETFLVDESSEYYLCVHDIDLYSEETNWSLTSKVSYDQFVKYINDNPDSEDGRDNRPRLVKISMKNGVVNKIERQYTP